MTSLGKIWNVLCFSKSSWVRSPWGMIFYLWGTLKAWKTLGSNKQKLFAILITNAKKERLAVRHWWATCQCLSFGSNIQKPESCNAKCLILQTRLRMVWEWWKANPSWESLAAHHLKQNLTVSLSMNAFTQWILRCYFFISFFTSIMSGNGESGVRHFSGKNGHYFFFSCSWFIRNVISHPTDILL